MPGNRRKSSSSAQIQIFEEIGLIQKIGFGQKSEQFRKIIGNHKKTHSGELHAAHGTRTCADEDSRKKLGRTYRSAAKIDRPMRRMKSPHDRGVLPQAIAHAYNAHPVDISTRILSGKTVILFPRSATASSGSIKSCGAVLDVSTIPNQTRLGSSKESGSFQAFIAT